MSRLPALVPASAAPASTGRCFRTHADGRIALTRDWLVLLRESRRASRLALQTRHGSARLVAFATQAELSVFSDPTRVVFGDAAGSLHCCVARWAQAWGWLRECACCGSPGRIEVHNAAGGEFLQLTAAPGGDAAAWSDYLGAVVGTGDGPALTEEPGGFALPRLVGAQARQPFQRDGFIALLQAFGDEELPLKFILRTAEIAHRRDICPRTILADDAMLHLGDTSASFQLAWPAVHELALTSDALGPALHLVDAQGAVLVSLSAAADPLAAATWRRAHHLLSSTST